MREVDAIIAGGTILTMDSHDARIEEGALAIEDDTIVEVGALADIKRDFFATRLIEASNCLVMPGLINGHTHAAMACFRGIADDLELMTWLNKFIFPAEARNVSPEFAYWGGLLACAEMIKSGTTTFCDMYIFEEETAQAARKAGLRCLLGEVLFDFPSPSYPTPAEGLAYTEKLIRKWDADDLVGIIVEPHSLYTCSPALLADAKRLADRFQVPYGLHLLENRNELLQLEKLFGKKPVSFLREAGYLTERFLAFHGVYLDDEDLTIFAEAGSKVVHNPESNMKLASGVAPVPAMLRAGITVGLGTDGCASNNNLDLFQEMDTAAKLHKAHSLDPTVMDAKAVVRLATRDGARALGLDKVTGSLEAGKKADIIIISLDKPHLTPLYNEFSQIVYAANGSDVETVLINGKVVMENRHLLTIDEKEIMARVREIAERIKRSLKDGRKE